MVGQGGNALGNGNWAENRKSDRGRGGWGGGWDANNKGENHWRQLVEIDSLWPLSLSGSYTAPSLGHHPSGSSRWWKSEGRCGLWQLLLAAAAPPLSGIDQPSLHTAEAAFASSLLHWSTLPLPLALAWLHSVGFWRSHLSVHNDVGSV